MRHKWKRTHVDQGLRARYSVCTNCKIVMEDTSCRGRSVRYRVQGKWLPRPPKCGSVDMSAS